MKYKYTLIQVKKMSQLNELDCKGCALSLNASNRVPKSLVPCGHSLCCECTDKLKSCVECKQEIQSLIPNYELIKFLQIIPSAPPAYTSTIHIESEPLTSTTAATITNPDTEYRKERNCSFHTFCTRISDHFFDLSLKRKSK